jgi:hypothetical protein
MDSSAASILGTDLQTGEQVTLEQEQRLKGFYVIGKTGSGKTTLLVNLILQDIAAGRGLCFFDTHGDAITDILRRFPANRSEEDVILLDLLDDDYAFGLNLFHCNDPTDRKEVSRVTSTIIDMFAKLFTDTGDLFKEAPTMAETLQNLIPVFLAQRNPLVTLAELPLFLMDETARTNMLASVNNPIVKSFWNSYKGWKPDQKERLVESTRRRVGNFLADPLVFHIIGQAETTVDFRRIMDEGKILLVKLSREHPLITGLVGSMIVSQIANAAFARANVPEAQRRQFHLYADEYQRFATPTFAELLTEVRKYKIATCVAHQARGQLDYKNRVAALNADNLVVFAVSGEDAQELSYQFDATPKRKKQVQRQRLEPKYKEWDEWVWTDEKAHAEYDQSSTLIYETQRKSSQAAGRLPLLAAAIGDAFSAYKPPARVDHWPTDGLDRLLANEPPTDGKTTWDELFVPPESYLRGLKRGEDRPQGLATRSGLVKLGESIVYDINDIFTEEEILQYEKNRTFRKEWFVLFSRLVEDTDEKTDIPLFLRQGGTVSVYEESYLLRPEAVDNVRLVKWLGRDFPDMKQELKKLLIPLYEKKMWWFVPDPTCVQRSHAVTYTTHDGLQQEKRYRGKLVDWINQSSPPAFGRERENTWWCAWGKWDTNHTFPEAVAWLREKVRSLMAQAIEEEAYWSAEAKKLTERKESLYAQYHVPIHQKEYLGEQPVTEERVRYVGERRTRYGSEPIIQTKDIQWYDLMEELDETPAQRRDEIANELANPKQQFTAWCKLVGCQS